MKIQKAIVKETLHVAVGVLIADAIMLVIFVLLRKFDLTVLFGALYGTFFAVLNFFLMGVGIQSAMEKSDGQKRAVQKSYVLRMLLLIAAMIGAVLLPCFHVIAALVPLLIPGIVIYILKLFQKPEKEEPSAPKEGDPQT